MQKEKRSHEKNAIEDAMNYLRYKDHTIFEVETHLKQKEYDLQEVKECIEFLKESHFVDDARYCEAYFRYALGKGKGPLRLRNELLQKGVQEEDLQRCMEENLDQNTIFSNAMKQVEKLTANSEVDSKLLAKVGRRLSYLGYPTDLIYRILNQLK